MPEIVKARDIVAGTDAVREIGGRISWGPSVKFVMEVRPVGDDGKFVFVYGTGYISHPFTPEENVERWEYREAIDQIGKEKGI